jgi:predicted lipoprotein with Yx(FWY)xxD motif
MTVNQSTRVARPAVKILAGLMLAALAATGCSSKKSTPAAAAPSAAASPAAGAAASPAASGPGGPAIVTANGPFLTDDAGRTLYLFVPDTTSASTCYGSCATFWPPLLTTGTPQATGSATAAMLGTSKRTDGTTQVTYNGHPLYYFKLDTKPGDNNGQGKNTSGGLWWDVAPAGTAITTPAAAASS